MRKKLILSGLTVFFLAGTFSSVTFAEEPVPGSEACAMAWSKGFDAVTKFTVENPNDGLAVYLSQNEIAQTDMWAAYRTISARHQCLLEAICSAVHHGGKLENLSITLAPKNIKGGALPGEFSSCPSGASIKDLMGTFTSEGEFRMEDMNACDFSNAATPDEERELRLIMYKSCRRHARLQNMIFDRVLRNMTMDDSTRKTVGYSALQDTSLVKRLGELRDKASELVGMFNAGILRLCTLSDPD